MRIAIAPDFEHLLPPLSEAEQATLAENCKRDPKHQTMPPVVVWKNHKHTIIDGHNQYRIRSALKLSIKYAEVIFATRDEAMKYALDIQFGRRNLDASQKAIAYAKLPRNTHGGDRSSDDDFQGANLHLEKMAENAGVSVRTMKHAGKVVDNSAASVIAAVEEGTVKVSDAAAIADLSKREQVAALAAVKKGTAKTLRAAATDFDPTKLKASANGKQKRNPNDRKLALDLLGKLIRTLDRLGLSPDLDRELRAINTAIRES